MSERLSLLTNLVGKDKVVRMEKQIGGRGSRISNAMSPNELNNYSDGFYGEFSGRLIGVSKGAEALDVKDVTAIGGWCALRTADMDKIRDEGVITDPMTGLVKSISSVPQMADWISKAVSIDQIIEAIGIFKGTQYTAISEEQAWGDRIKSETSRWLKRKLIPQEIAQLEDALDGAELKRYTYTNRYLDYATQTKNSLSRVVDYTISDELERIRNSMLEEAGVDIKKLMALFPNEISSIPGYSKIWGMYIGPYLALLQNLNLVTTPKGIIVEPSFHALSETEAKTYVTTGIFGKSKNNYLGNGMNANLGFAAFAELMSPRGERMAKQLTINEMPNTENWQVFLKSLEENAKCANLTLAENPAFVWGVNVFPYGRAREALLAMISIKDEYQKRRKTSGVASTIDLKGDNSLKINELKSELGIYMFEQSRVIIYELEKMFRAVFA